MPNYNKTQPAAARSTEGQHDGASMTTKSAETRRGRGRPKGSSNAPRSLINKKIAESVLLNIKPLLSVADYEEVKAAIKSGKSISTLKEVKIMMALMAPPIWQRLIEEQKQPEKSELDSELEEDGIGLEPQTVEMARDLNERVKVWKDLAVLASNLEKTVDEGTDSQSEPLSEQFKKRGLLIDRFTISGRIGPGSMGGDSHGFGGAADSARAIPSELPPRHVNPENREEVETTGLFDTDSD